MLPHSFRPTNTTKSSSTKVTTESENTLFRVLAEEIENGDFYEFPADGFEDEKQCEDFEKVYNVGGCEIMLAVHGTMWIHYQHENGTAGPYTHTTILEKDAYLYAFYMEGEEVDLDDQQRIELEEAIESKMDIE